MTEAIRYERDEQRIVTLTIDMPGQSANTMNPAFRAALAATVGRLTAEKNDIAGVILTSAKKTFFAGGDLNHLLAARPEDAAALFERAQGMKALLRRLETLGPPVVAALNGTALGGGFEIALACHARFVLDDAAIALGLPEANLGLLPGGGGVVRLVRLLGVEAAMPLIVEGPTFDPGRALALKLVDGLAPDLNALRARAREWIAANPQPQQPWDRKGFRLPGSTANAVAPLAWLRSAPLALMAKHRGLYPAPEAAMSAVVECAAVDFDTASRIESRYLVQLATHPVSKNLITTFFFQMNEIKNGKGRPEGQPPSAVQRLGVLGAGMMGAGIALAAAQRGLPVVLKDVSAEAAQQGKARIGKTLARLVEKARLDAERMALTLALIQPTGDAGELQGCDLIIESVFEKRDVKAQATAEAEAMLAPGGFIGSNTSTLPITGLAAAVARPGHFIGIHFFSPVDRMPLVEVILGKETSEEALARALDFVRQIRKTPIVVHDSRSFYTSRVFATYTNEGMALLKDGVHPAIIENAAVQAGMAVGPLAVSDEVTIELIYKVDRQSRLDLGKSYNAPSAMDVVHEMVERQKRPGRRFGKGFYDYPEGQKKRLWPGLAQVWPLAAAQPDVEEVKRRLLYIQALETARCHEEGVITAPADADIGSILGWGFPSWTGGTLSLIDTVGAAAFVAECERMAKAHGPRFVPTEGLRRMAGRGELYFPVTTN